MQHKTLFHLLLVITYIFAGLSAFSYLVTAAMLPTMQQLYADNPGLLPEQFGVMMQQMLDTPRGYFLGAGLLYLLEVLGAALMWRLRWTGFHCYTLSRLLLLLLPLLFLGRGFVGIGDIMFALLFVAVYYMLMRRLTADEKEPPAGEGDTPQE
ncbi:MAG: hypothetical protein IJ524_02745 [Bacteroidales bacterium]|nr:hypothetical protein [Bacteroidales bacterium]